MNGFIGKRMAACGLAAGLLTGAGCATYRDIVDPCYPARYSAMAAAEVNQAMAPQVHNGHILDQTVWNDQFEKDQFGNGTAHLTRGGMEHLAYLARRRPCPDPVVYLQTAEDIRYDDNAPEKFVLDRDQLDSSRMEAVQKYLIAQTAGRGVPFQVVRQDPHEVGENGRFYQIVGQKLDLSGQGVLKMYGSSLTGGGGGGSGN